MTGIGSCSGIGSCGEMGWDDEYWIGEGDRMEDLRSASGDRRGGSYVGSGGGESVANEHQVYKKRRGTKIYMILKNSSQSSSSSYE